MKQLYLLFLLSLVFTSCATHREVFETGGTYSSFKGFTPVDPVEYVDEIELVADGKFYWKNIKLMNSDEIFQFLNNETVLVSIGQVNLEGGISYLPITLSTKNTSYKVTMDYMKFATLAQENSNGSFIGFNRVGVGLRLVSLLTATESGINIGDLSSIGMAARAGTIKGTLMIEVVGINSKEVTTLLPLPSEINQTTIQNAMQALATIKSKIYDEETKLYPQVMAIMPDTTSRKRTVVIKNPDIVTEDGTVISNGQTVTLPNPQEDPTSNLANDIQLQIGHSKSSSSKFQQAQKLEIEAFDFLFAKNITQSILTFEACEKVYPGFHSVYDINRILKAEKTELLDPNSPKWKEVYSKISKDFSWKLSNEILQKLNAEAN